MVVVSAGRGPQLAGRQQGEACSCFPSAAPQRHFGAGGCCPSAARSLRTPFAGGSRRPGGFVVRGRPLAAMEIASTKPHRRYGADLRYRGGGALLGGARRGRRGPRADRRCRIVRLSRHRAPCSAAGRAVRRASRSRPRCPAAGRLVSGWLLVAAIRQCRVRSGASDRHVRQRVSLSRGQAWPARQGEQGRASTGFHSAG